MIRIITICLGLAAFHTIYAQGVNPDSLRKRLASATRATDSLEVQLKLAEVYLYRQNTDSAFFFSTSALEHTYNHSLPKQKAQTLDILGKTYFSTGSYILARKSFEDGVEQARLAGAPEMRAHLLNSLSVVCNRQGDLKTALQSLMEARGIWDSLENKQQEMVLLVNISAIQTKLKNYDLAEQTATEALHMGEDLKNPSMVFSSYNNLGGISEDLGRFDQAESYYLKAFQMIAAQGVTPYYTTILTNLFYCRFRLGQKDSAEATYARAYASATQTNNKSGLQQLLRARARAMGEAGLPIQALEYYKQSLELALELKQASVVMDIYLKMAELHAITGNFRDAYISRTRYDSLQHQIQTETNSRQLLELSSVFDVQQKEAEIVRLKRQQEIQKLRFYGVLLLAVSFVTALIALYSRYALRQKSHRQLEKQNREIQEQNLVLEQQRMEIDEQNTKLEQANKDLQQFAYAASHDLREPLHTINRQIQMVERRFSEQLVPEAKDYLQFASDGVRRLDTLLEGLLEFSRLGRRNVQKSVVDLNRLWDEIVQDLGDRILETHARVELDPMPHIEGFRPELRLLFQNLLQNALKFTHPGVPPLVQVTVAKEEQGYVIAISDNGIGISPEHHGRIFTMFERLHNRNEYEGSGIGLALCKRIVENHGGEIWVESQPGEGSTFFVRLPL